MPPLRGSTVLFVQSGGSRHRLISDGPQALSHIEPANFRHHLD